MNKFYLAQFAGLKVLFQIEISLMKILLRSKGARKINMIFCYLIDIACSKSNFLMKVIQPFRLLYAVFVVSSENATVAELATTLQADLSQLQAAASFACRLGWAVKLIDPGSILQETKIPGTPGITLTDEEDAFRGSISSISTDGDAAQYGDISGSDNKGPRSGYVRAAFIVDANITSYLMMGSVSPGIINPTFSFRMQNDNTINAEGI